jgi:hypothetical protein
MDDVIQSNIDIVNALNNLGTHTFRDGKLLATIGGFQSSEEKLIIEYINCSWDDEYFHIELPLIFIGYVRDMEPLEYFYKIFKSFVSMGRS